MLNQHLQVSSCKELLEEYQYRRNAHTPEKLFFSGVGERDVYNITAPFMDRGEMVIAGRVEARDSERSEIRFFAERDGVWGLRDNDKTFELQDPFVAFIHGKLVLGGVEVSFDEFAPDRITSWRTVFYCGNEIDSLTYLATGPENMKDIRLVELPDNGIGVFTRPHDLDDARALIGYIRINNLQELKADVIAAASLFRDQFIPEESGGPNEIHVLSNGLLGVLGHIACREEGEVLHYYAMAFAMHPDTLERTPLKLLAVRDDFLPGETKQERLRDVVFSGGIKRLGDGTAWLYAGVSDAEAQRLRIPDPFLEYETWGIQLSKKFTHIKTLLCKSRGSGLVE